MNEKIKKVFIIVASFLLTIMISPQQYSTPSEFLSHKIMLAKRFIPTRYMYNYLVELLNKTASTGFAKTFFLNDYESLIKRKFISSDKKNKLYKKSVYINGRAIPIFMNDSRQVIDKQMKEEIYRFYLERKQ